MEIRHTPDSLRHHIPLHTSITIQDLQWLSIPHSNLRNSSSNTLQMLITITVTLILQRYQSLQDTCLLDHKDTLQYLDLVHGRIQCQCPHDAHSSKRLRNQQAILRSNRSNLHPRIILVNFGPPQCSLLQLQLLKSYIGLPSGNRCTEKIVEDII